MSDYNAAERRDVRRAEKESALAERERHDQVKLLMSSTAGRKYVLSRLTSAHIFQTSFSTNALMMAFTEGERNQGLQLLNDIMAVCPDMYLRMMQEHNERDITAGTTRTRARANGRDLGSEVYDSADGDEDDASDLDTSDYTLASRG